ncbi:hypothetical protein VTN96DRAFT_351 [Rasamsonia emersonii]
MKFSLSIVAILSLVGAITALPSPVNPPEEQKDPPLAALTLANAPPHNEKFQCGGNTYTGYDIYVAARYGLSLYLAKQTRGRNKYPESFYSDDSKGVKLHFPPDCPADHSRYSFPLKKGGVPYNGGPNNRNQGDERVVYYYEDGEIDGDTKHPKAYYCGIMTHKGAAVGGFHQC